MKKPVAIDMEIIINPYKLLSVINCIDKIYSEIVMPLPLTFIEIWHPKWRSFTFKPFLDDSIMEVDLEDFFGYTDGITSNNFIAGIKLLRMAYDKGMIQVLDYPNSMKYEKNGKELLNISGNFNNIQKLQTGTGYNLYICPDLPVSEMLYGMQNDNINVLYGNDEFINYWHTKLNYTTTNMELPKTSFYTSIDGTLQTLLYTNKIHDLSEAFAYVSSKNNFEKLDIELRNTINDYQKKKELFFLTLEFATTTIADTLIGIPLTTSSLFTYRFCKKIIQKDKE